MRQVKELQKALQVQYGINISEFLKAYEDNVKLKDMLRLFNTTPWKLKSISAALNLRLAKKHRQGDLDMLLVRESDKADSELLIKLKEQESILDQLSTDFANQSANLLRSQNRTNILKRSLREATRADNFQEEITSSILESLHLKVPRVKVNCIEPKDAQYEQYISVLVLSDLHAEELVTIDDVGEANSYTWEIMQERVDKVFTEWFIAHRGESRGVLLIGGDLFSGIIHQALENATMPIAKAVVKLTELLVAYISAASDIFDTVEILFVNGNHSRISENIKAPKKGFDFEYLCGNLLESRCEKYPNVDFTISTTGYACIGVGNKILGLHHGDHFRGDVFGESRMFKVYEAFKAVLGIEVDHIVQGHTHNFSYHNSHKGAYIVNGSLIGSNAYGITNGFLPISASQTIIQFTPLGEVECVKQVLC